jgi:adenylate cyclase
VLESVRVAARLKDYELTPRYGMLSLRLGDTDIVAQADGQVWVHYSESLDSRFVSAVDVLEGRDDPALLEGRIVMVGVTAIGLESFHMTSLRRLQSAVEIHAQVAENIGDNAALVRPPWARFIEALAFLLSAAFVVVRVPTMKPTAAIAVPVTCVLLITAGGVAAFKYAQLLFDPATLIVAIVIHFTVVMAWGYFASASSQRFDR